MHRHIISILMENEAGALSRIAGLFSARAYNIDSLTVSTTEDPSMSRMTIVTLGSLEIVEQITKQLNKLIDVVVLMDLTEGDHIERELALVKIKAEGADREELTRLVDIFRGNIVDVTSEIYVVEITGASEKIDAFVKTLDKSLIIEMVRSGVSGIARGDRYLKQPD